MSDPTQPQQTASEAIGTVARKVETLLAELLEEHQLVTIEQIRRRCHWTHTSGKPDVLHIDGVAVLELGPLEFEQGAEGERYVITVTQKVRRL